MSTEIVVVGEIYRQHVAFKADLKSPADGIVLCILPGLPRILELQDLLVGREAHTSGIESLCRGR